MQSSGKMSEDYKRAYHETNKKQTPASEPVVQEGREKIKKTPPNARASLLTPPKKQTIKGTRKLIITQNFNQKRCGSIDPDKITHFLTLLDLVCKLQPATCKDKVT